MKTMKFITLCASVLLAASAARAQHTVGVFGGFGTGTARFYPAQETKSVGGRFSGGFSWRYYSATRFVGCVGVDLEFLQRGFAYAPFASTTENEADYVYYTRKLNSFVVPLVWQPHFYLARRHLRVYLEAALTFSYNFDSSYVNDVARENGVEPWRGKYEFKTARDNRWGYGLAGGAGLAVLIGRFEVSAGAAPGSGLAETHLIMEQVADRIEDIPQIRDFMQVAGYGMIAGQGSSYGMCIIKLKDWAERPEKSDAVQAVIGQIYARTADIKDAQIFAVAPPMISGYGTSTGFSPNLQDKAGGELTDFYNIYLKFIGALNQRPEIERAYSTFNINFPQYLVDIDAAKAKRAGVSPSTVLSTLAGYYGGQYVSNINRFSKMYYVTLQADPKYRLDTESLNNVYVRTDSGEMAPLSQFVNLTRVYSSEVLNRFNLYNSIAVNGTAASGYSSGDAIQAIREVAAEVLPKGYGFEFDGITREEAQTGSNTAIIFGICILLIYLILSALYESFFVPFAVILAVPCGLTGSFLMAKAMGLENNIYLQTGIIMLIGLLSKTASLITEYAADRRAGGMSLTQAAVSAAKARLRPILMTVLTCVFGMIPLMLSHGVGANGNSTLGSGVVGGMIVGTLALLFLVPTLFIVFQTLQEKIKPVEFTSPDWCIQAEIEENQKEPIDEEAKTDDDTK